MEILSRVNLQPQGARSNELLDLKLFGPIKLMVGEMVACKLRTRSSYWVLALLALKDGRDVARDWLAATIWPNSLPESALYNLRRSLSEIRSALGPGADDYIAATRRTVKLNPQFVSVDLWRFDAAIQSDHTGSNSMPDSEAMALYAGELLEGCQEEWIFGEREERRHAYTRLALQAFRAANSEKEQMLAIGYLRKARIHDPFSEPIVQALIRLLKGTGDISGAQIAYREFASNLHRELNEYPSPTTRQLYEELTVSPKFAPTRISATPSKLRAERVGTFTSSNTMFGRQEELANIQEAIEAHRLITLVGPGGVGKTSLALAVCQAQVAKGNDNVRLIELSGASDPSVLVSVLSQQLGFQQSLDTEALLSLCEAIGDQSLLVVLDNCEHLIVALVPVVRTILKMCPNTVLLATSTQPMQLSDELTLRVEPLPIPALGTEACEAELEAAFDSPSVRLFESRAQLADSSFALDKRNVRSIISICGQLGGIPLAIELAANQVRSMTPNEIETELGYGLMRLNGSNNAHSRHRSLHSLVAWSFGLLSPPEQAMLAILSVFAGGWSLEAAKTVCAEVSENMDASSILSSIVTKSLVQRTSNGETSRYSMLEPIREFACGQLDEMGRVLSTRQAHLDYFCEFCCRADANIAGSDEQQWLSRVSLELDNIRAALAYALAHESTRGTALRMVASLGRFWLLQGMLTEGREYARQALETTQPSVSNDRASAVHVAGLLVARQGDMNAAENFQSEALESYQILGSQKGVAKSLSALGLVNSGRGEYVAARTRLEQALALHRILKDQIGEATVLNNLGLVAWYQGQFADARRMHEESLAIKRHLKIPRSIGFSLTNLGLVAMAEGQFNKAEAYLNESLDIRRKACDAWGIADSLTYLGTIARQRRMFDLANEMLKESHAIYHGIGCQPGTAFAMNQLALISLHEGDIRSARDMLIQCLEISKKSNDWRSVSQNLNSAGATLLRYEHAEQAIEVWGSSERIRTDTHSSLQQYERAELDAWIAESRRTVDEEQFHTSWIIGESRERLESVTRSYQYLVAAI